LGYAYVVEGVRYAGYFVIFGDEEKARRLQGELADVPVQIRYDPSNPNVSYLVNLYDSRFGGVGANQNPERLDQAPAFDIAETLRHSS
jgi:hypothetical protein